MKSPGKSDTRMACHEKPYSGRSRAGKIMTGPIRGQGRVLQVMCLGRNVGEHAPSPRLVAATSLQNLNCSPSVDQVRRIH